MLPASAAAVLEGVGPDMRGKLPPFGAQEVVLRLTMRAEFVYEMMRRTFILRVRHLAKMTSRNLRFDLCPCKENHRIAYAQLESSIQNLKRAEERFGLGVSDVLLFFLILLSIYTKCKPDGAAKSQNMWMCD